MNPKALQMKRRSVAFNLFSVVRMGPCWFVWRYGCFDDGVTRVQGRDNKKGREKKVRYKKQNRKHE